MTQEEKNKALITGRKIYLLSVQGVGGEKENAVKMLEAFLTKYNFTIQDVLPEIRTKRIFIGVNREMHQMFANLCASIIGKDFQLYQLRGPGRMSIMATDQEFYDLSERWRIYRKELHKILLKKKKEQQKELELLTGAFIHKHKLYANDKDENSEEDRQLTHEEILEIMKMLKMTEGMNDINFYKRLIK